METFIKPKALVDNPHYPIQRQKTLAGLSDDDIDVPIVLLVRAFNKVPYCFTLQSCYGHFVWAEQDNPRNLEPLPAAAPVGSIERLGDTETQAASVLGKLETELAASGYTFADVVKMNVFLVGDPARDGRMDFEGLMKAYSRYVGAASQGKLPARTTVQVAESRQRMSS